MIASEPERYGFESIKNPEWEFPSDFVELRKSIRLSDIAKNLKVPLHLVKHWNPELRRDYTPPLSPNDTYLLRVPSKFKNRMLASISNIKPQKPPKLHLHKVARGETFSSIARKYKIRLSKLRSYNPNISPRRLAVGKSVRVPF